MNGAIWFGVGLVVGVVVITRIKPANTSSCCTRVAYGARDTIAGYAGPLDSVAAGALDFLGVTNHLPGLLDQLGVPYDD